MTWARTNLCGALLGSVAFLYVAGVEASPVGFSLTWDAPAQCPTSDYLRAQVETLLAGAPATLVWVAARAEVSHREDGMWTVRLTTDRGGTVGERSLEADSCRSLADATALVVALTIDPAHVASAAARLSDPAPLPTAPVLAAPARPTPAPVSPAPPAAPRRVESPIANGAKTPLRFALLPAIAGDLGTLPSWSYGASLAGAVHVGRFRTEVYGAYWPNQIAHPATAPSGEGGEVELFAGGIRVCFPVSDERQRFQRIELSPCAGLEAGELHGQGLNLPHSLTQTGLWLAATLDARAVVRLSRAWGIVVDAEAAVPFRRDAFTLGTAPAAPSIDRAGAIEGRAWIGPELRF